MGQSITSRLPDALVKEIERISEIEKLDKSSVVRRLLARAIDEWNMDHAVAAFQKGEISMGLAVEMAHVSIWAFLAKLHELKIPISYDVADLEEDLKYVQELGAKEP